MGTSFDRKWTAIGVILMALAIATALTLGDVQLATSQTVTLVAKRTDVDVPINEPFDSVWKRASTVEVPLSAQNLVPPMAGGDHTVKARALHDGERLYILAEWEDDTEDKLVSRQTEFSDAVAVQFPVTEGERVPAFCMGDPNAPVNIWQWKAAWQSDIEEGFVDIEDAFPNTHVDFYPFEDEESFYPARAVGNVFAEVNRTTAADNLLAGGFGTLNQAPDQVVQGVGEWRDGRWRVVFVRELTVSGEYAQFAVDENTNVAFATWDGAEAERDGMKSVSQFMTLNISSELAEAPSSDFPVWAIILIVLGGIALAAVVAGGYMAQRGQAS